ncbi:acetyl-CoA C-acetyltransferase [Paenibacillus soyae]|uniref:acetyl-CoA C-acetyltransferase n=1 Tax=Paenibacillus soyae TaxID=2969249 RepID=A0A9X2MU53_9BACL|nr:acetyl-CoA C-acetyltransferase [Paenibacillus soyae]MCR2803847.1 acetyl-CoA C-acetyltransferase [Paenibacillus soyae]
MAERTVVVGAARTPFGRFGGVLKHVSAVQLGGAAIGEAVKRAGLESGDIEKAIMGMVIQGGAGQVPSRQAAREAGLPWETASETLNKVCASGMRAVTLADQIIRAGDGSVIVAGGMESMSGAPYGLKGYRWGSRMGHGQALDLMLHDGLTCPFGTVHMGVYGDESAEVHGISREAQDEWAFRSHQRAVKAIEEGKLAEEIVPVRTQGAKGEASIADMDEAPRRDASISAMAKLPPLFGERGTVTAGNAPGVNDGAAALVLMAEGAARARGIRPLATIIGHAEVALEAERIAEAPGHAVRKLLSAAGVGLEEIALFEINEAFAAVVLASGKLVGWKPDLVNVNGGAIALGHPIGASGARIVMSLIYELRRRGGGLGIAAICSGTAQGDAVLLKVEG